MKTTIQGVLLLLFMSVAISYQAVYGSSNIVNFNLAFKSPRAETIKKSIMIKDQLLYVSRLPSMDGTDIDKVEVGKRTEYRTSSSTNKLEKIFIHYVHIKMTENGRKKLAEISSKYIGHYLVIFINNEPIMAPRIQGEIDDGNVLLSNLISEEAAEMMANQIRR